jgi:hypothetical protein
MKRVIQGLCVDDKRRLEHSRNMADDGLTLKITSALSNSLRARAKAAGQSVEDYALGILGNAVEPSGVADSEIPWTEATILGSYDLDQDSEAYADELDRICDQALRTGGVPWEQVEARLRNFGQRR